jgi:hypothetical protein
MEVNVYVAVLTEDRFSGMMGEALALTLAANAVSKKKPF